jgi:hypothetical protein
MKAALSTLSLITVLGWTAEAGAAPGWCSGIGANRVDPSGSIKDAIEDTDPRNALKNLVARICKPNDDDNEAMKDLEAARQKWSSRLDLTDTDWGDVAAYATLGQGERMSGEVHLLNDSDQARKRAWSSFDAIDQYVWLNSDMGASDSLTLDHNYLADAFGARLTELGRLAYVRNCIKNGNGPVQWAMCQGDIDGLDLKKAIADVRENKAYGAADKISFRIVVDELRPKLTEHAAKVKTLIASDPGYAKMFEVAAAARKEWEDRSKTDAALIALANQMDDARATNSRSGFAGCEEKTWAGWKSAMASVPAKKFEGMHDDRQNGKSFLDTAMTPITTNPSAYLASVALVTCMTVGQDHDAKHDVLIRTLGTEMLYWPGFRGPRTAAESAILMAGISLDDRDAKLDFPRKSRPFGERGGSRSGGGAGVIAKLTPAGKMVTVEFKKQMVKQVQCAETKRTNRVVQIQGDGTLVYEVICLRNETVTVNKADDPQTVNPRYLEGVQPGMYLSIVEDVVTAAWKPGAAAPSMVFGVALK